jgi:hypothetical protein
MARMKVMQGKAVSAVRRGIQQVATATGAAPAQATAVRPGQPRKTEKREAPAAPPPKSATELASALEADPVWALSSATSEGVDTVSALASDVQWWHPSRLPAAEVAQSASSVQLFVQHVTLHSIAINVTFVRDTSVATTGPAAATVSGGMSMLTSPISTTLGALGVMALSLNRAPVRLNGLELVNVLAGPSELVTRISQHYVSAALTEVYKVKGWNDA